MKVERARFGETGEQIVHTFTLDNDVLRLRLCELGAASISLLAPDRHGRRDDVLLGYAGFGDYLNDDAHLGAIAGRHAGRIANSRFTLDGVLHKLATNAGIHHLHGGLLGFGRRVWRGAATKNGVIFSLTSAAGDQGYPGAVEATATYELTDNRVTITLAARTDAPTVVNLTNHAYFNLDGPGSVDIRDHEIQINAAHYLPMDDESIVTGEIASVADTPFDLRQARRIGTGLTDPHPQIRAGHGYDHCFVLDESRAMALHAPLFGRQLRIDTNQPGVQFYTGNYLNVAAGHARRAEGYGKHAGLCLETQRFPDGPNRANFPSSVLQPGEQYLSITHWTLSAE